MQQQFPLFACFCSLSSTLSLSSFWWIMWRWWIIDKIAETKVLNSNSTVKRLCTMCHRHRSELFMIWMSVYSFFFLLIALSLAGSWGGCWSLSQLSVLVSFIKDSMQIYYRWCIEDRVQWPSEKVDGWPSISTVGSKFLERMEVWGVNDSRRCVHVRSALLCIPVINGCRFISEPALLTLSITQSDAWRRAPAVHRGQLKLMMLLFKAVMSLSRLFVSLVMSNWSLHPCFLNVEDIFILHGKDKKNPLIYGLFTTSRYVSKQSSRSWNKYINIHGAKHQTI